MPTGTIGSVLGAGLHLTALEEHRTLEWQGLPHMEEGDGLWRPPDDQADSAPLMYTLTAVKPEVSG